MFQYLPILGRSSIWDLKYTFSDNTYNHGILNSNGIDQIDIDVDDNATKVNHNTHKTVNDISHINHRPSNLYFNPSRLIEDNQYLINDNTSEYYTDNEFVKAFTTSDKSFSILNLDIRSISKNIGKLKEYLDIIKHNFSIITIQETWFTEDTCLEYYNLPDYSLESINRIDCNVGGVGVYISNAIDYKVRTDLKGTNGRQKTYEIFHVYCTFYSSFMCQTTVNFGITKDGSLVLNT